MFGFLFIQKIHLKVFEISKKINNCFPENFEIKNTIFLNLDLGWKRIEYKNYIIFFKGYVLENFTDEVFYQKIIENPIPQFNGNFFSIIVGENIIITNDRCRGSPLQYVQKEKVTNLDKDLTPAWADAYLTIDPNFTVTENKFTPYHPTYKNITYDSALDQVDKILCDSFENFLSKNNKPIKVFLSGGIDTLTM